MTDFLVYAEADGKCSLKEEGKEPREFTDILQVIDHLNVVKAEEGGVIALTVYDPLGNSVFRDWLL